jgi:hypothetical protein
MAEKDFNLDHLTETLRSVLNYFELHLRHVEGQLVLVSDLYEDFSFCPDNPLVEYKIFLALLHYFLSMSDRFSTSDLKRSRLPLKKTPFRSYIQDAMFVNGKSNFPIMTDLETYDPRELNDGWIPPSDPLATLWLILFVAACFYFVLSVLIYLLYWMMILLLSYLI